MSSFLIRVKFPRWNGCFSWPSVILQVPNFIWVDPKLHFTTCRKPRQKSFTCSLYKWSTFRQSIISHLILFEQVTSTSAIFQGNISFLAIND